MEIFHKTKGSMHYKNSDKTSNSKKSNHVYKDDIIRLFHVKTKRFLSIKHRESSIFKVEKKNNLSTKKSNNSACHWLARGYSNCLQKAIWHSHSSHKQKNYDTLIQ